MVRSREKEKKLDPPVKERKREERAGPSSQRERESGVEVRVVRKFRGGLCKQISLDSF